MGEIDLFAGLGGIDEGARSLGIAPLGIEWNDAACATREAAGHRTLQGDVAALDPRELGPCKVLVGSPPCQARSMAGKGGGKRDLAHVFACLDDLARGDDTRAFHLEKCEDARSMLVVEPLRWALALRPRRIMLEQVPPVIEEWERVAQILRGAGYATWTGILSAERFGVPQTRKRAILMASLDGKVRPPIPTHARYVAPPKERQADVLFDAGDRGRIVLAEDRGLLPWVSMAEALGWGMTERPIGTVSHDPSAGGSGACTRIKGERERAAWAFRATNDRPNGCERPAPAPAPALAFGHESPVWVVERPSTSVCATDRIGRPGHKDFSNGGESQFAKDAVRVTLQEALILQGFRPDYPVQGSRTKQFEQVGNAVPPPLARAVLAALGV